MAASFVKGSSQRIDLGNVDAFRDQFTGSLMAWVRLDANITGTDERILFVATNTSLAARCALGIVAGNVVRYVSRRLDADSPQSLTGGSLTLGVWHLIVGTSHWASQRMRLYLDGTLIASTNPAAWTGATSNTGATSASIGSAHTTTAQYVSATVQEARTYRKELAAAEAAAMFAARGADRIRNGIYNRWILNNGAPGGVIGASEARDYGPGQNHGSGVNSPVWSGAPLRTRPKAI